MLSDVPKVCLLLATLLGSAHSLRTCDRRITWWDRHRGACVPCTRCEPLLAVKYPCELHRDTICQTISEIHIDFGHRIIQNDSTEFDIEDLGYSEVSENGEVLWDVQTTMLTLAASGCVVFFVVVLYVSFYHAKQWKVLKRALRSDVQDLSAKLKLMEAGESPAEPVVSADHHIYCNIHVSKDAFIGPPTAKKGLGNVYTQEKLPS